MRHIITIAVLAFATAAQDADPLRGPDVPEGDTRTLVDRTMTGGFQRIEGRPEAAALVLIDLDPDTRRRAQAVVARRDMAVTLMLVDHLDAVREITDHITAGDRDAAHARLIELWAEFEPDAPRDPLLVPLADVLTDEQMRRLEHLVAEYWDAWIDSQLPKGADDDARAQAQHRLAFQLFQEEVRRGYEASLRSYQQALEAVYQAVDPTPDQREAIRTVVIEHIKATRLRPTPDQRRRAWHDIYQLLDDQRKQLFFDYLLRQVVKDG